MDKILTNQEIFARAINGHPLNAGILREALSHYADLINSSEPWGDDIFFNFYSWKECVNELKNFIDNLYQENH